MTIYDILINFAKREFIFLVFCLFVGFLFSKIFFREGVKRVLFFSAFYGLVGLFLIIFTIGPFSEFIEFIPKWILFALAFLMLNILCAILARIFIKNINLSKAFGLSLALNIIPAFYFFVKIYSKFENGVTTLN